MEELNKITNIDEKKFLEDKEMIFDALILEELINVFIEDLENAGFDKEEIDEFLNEIDRYGNEAVKGILAIPKELRERNFAKYKKAIDDKKTTVKDIVYKIHQTAEKNGYTLGYHATKTDIPNDGIGWDVKGTELDDRDNRQMAYYSLDYKDVYRVDRGDKLYVVRAQTGKDTTHKVDTSNNWGRADSLSIIHKIDLTKIDEKVEEKLKEIRQQQRDAA